MTIQSMTGFAREEGSSEGARWAWELRSVNGKALDIRFRLPGGMEALETVLRERLSVHVQRGNVQVSLQVETEATAVLPVLNEEAFEAARTMVARAAEKAGLPPSGLDTILSIKGVIEYREQGTDPRIVEARQAAILASFEKAATALANARSAEGRTIADVLSRQVDEIEELRKQVENDPSRSAERIRERLCQQVERLAGSASLLDEQRLHQEAAILATKADLQEEIDRLSAHVGSARNLLAEGGAIGRKLDFLCQEFNRECNTICSKSNAVEVTAAGLEMKVVIDRFREQVQNIQ